MKRGSRVLSLVLSGVLSVSMAFGPVAYGASLSDAASNGTGGGFTEC